MTKKNEPMAFFTLADRTGSIEVLVFPKVIEKASTFLENDKIIEVTGRLSEKDEEFKLIADEVKELPNDDVYKSALSEKEKTIKLTIFMASLSNMEALNEIKNILLKFPGQAPVYLSVGIGQNAKIIKTQSQVRASSELVAELRKVSTVSKVEVM
jgi:DNA polymerase-3 subunit alpha